jgi:hypothetical protein
METKQDFLLLALISLAGRAVFPPDKLLKIVYSKGSGTKQIKAFNLCDGSRTQADVVKQCKLDAGNFSRTVSRWIEEGIVFRIGEGRDAKLLHIYSLPASASKTNRRGEDE